MSFKKLVVPNRIQEFDEEMLVPLDRNFSEIQRHMQITQGRMDTAEASIITLDGNMTILDGNLTTVNDALTDHVTEPYLHGLFYNKVINGNFSINQRAVAGTVTLAATEYGHDRWRGGAAGCEYTFATVENITTLTIASGTLEQVVEGNNLLTGNYTVSWEGTSQLQLGGIAYDSPVILTTTGGTNGTLEFGTGTLNRVQLTRGEIEREFEDRPYGTELSLCQRYYQLLYLYNAFRCFRYSTSVVAFHIPYITTMRNDATLITGTETTDWRIRTLLSSSQTGFTLTKARARPTHMEIEATKTSHGLTDAHLMVFTDGGIAFDAEI